MAGPLRPCGPPYKGSRLPFLPGLAPSTGMATGFRLSLSRDIAMDALRILPAFFLVCVLTPGLRAAPAGPASRDAPPPLSEKERKRQEWLVGEVARTPLHRLTRAQVDYFLKNVDPAQLPPKLRKIYFADRADIIEAGLHKKGTTTEEIERAQRRKAERKAKRKRKRKRRKVDPNNPESLLKAGYEELEKKEVNWLSKETKCSEQELTEFSTLKIVFGLSKDKKANVRYFMHGKDPLYAAVANFRAGHKKIGGTRVFGSKTRTYCKD